MSHLQIQIMIEIHVDLCSLYKLKSPFEAVNLSLEVLDPVIKRRISVKRDLMRVELAASDKRDRTFKFLQCSMLLDPGADDACFALLRTPVVSFTLYPCGPLWAIECFPFSSCPTPALHHVLCTGAVWRLNSTVRQENELISCPKWLSRSN